MLVYINYLGICMHKTKAPARMSPQVSKLLQVNSYVSFQIIPTSSCLTRQPQNSISDINNQSRFGRFF